MTRAVPPSSFFELRTAVAKLPAAGDNSTGFAGHTVEPVTSSLGDSGADVAGTAVGGGGGCCCC